jgi:acetolactate synthase-1/2/3 large subunit
VYFLSVIYIHFLSKTAADIVIDTLKNNGVEYVFGIPGAKIDYLFNALIDDGPELIE